MEPKKNKISFSEMKTWVFCSHKHKVVYIDKATRFEGNEFTIFGNALHFSYEQQALGNLEKTPEEFFVDDFKERQEVLKAKGIELDDSFLREMEEEGKKLAPQVLPALKSFFGSYEVVGCEIRLEEPFEDTEYNFKGFVDLVVKSKGKYHIIDWKTCSWGWTAEKKNDKINAYQLCLYKNFYSQKYGVDPKDIEVYFGLAKRTAKKDQIEIFRITSGKRKITNALNLVKKAIYNIDKKFSVKNRLSCDKCELYKTQYCK